jgi:hypothetical protein
MSAILMMFILPIGILTFFWDRKNYAQNIQTFSDYVEKISHADIDSTKKIAAIDEMFYQNGYKNLEQTSSFLKVQKKHFNLGLLFIFVGLFTYFGLLLYWIYYRFLLKPNFLCIDLEELPALQVCDT